VDRDEDGRNPARRRPNLAGKGRGSDPCSPRVPFRRLEGSEEVPAAVLGGALHPWPPVPRFLRGDRLWSWSGGRGRCRGVVGRQRCAQEWGRGARGGAAQARHACSLCGWRVSGLARGHGRDLSSAGGRRVFKAWDQGGRAGPGLTSGEAETRPVRCSNTLACAGSREHQHTTPFISQ
jgi:hypothetical protein